MYIRVKRNKTTYFVQCDPTETVLDIKQKLHSLIEHPVKNQRLILVSTNDILDDSKTLADQKVNQTFRSCFLCALILYLHYDLVSALEQLGLPIM